MIIKNIPRISLLLLGLTVFNPRARAEVISLQDLVESVQTCPDDSVAELNSLLANEFILYTKTLNYHWNVTGMSFGPLHALFKDQYEKLFGYIDRIAERIRAVQGTPISSLTEFLTNATLAQEKSSNLDDREMIQNLLVDHEAVIAQIKSIAEHTAQDLGTNNMLTDLIEKHEKIAWMLRAHLQ